MNVFSFSRLSLYEMCPRRFYSKYVLGFQEPMTKPLALGKAVHKAKELLIHGVSEEEAIIAALIECDFHPDVSREEIETLVRRAPNVDGETEVRFEFPLADGSDLRLQGYIDLVQPGAFYDWKTNWRMYGVYDTMQLPLYAWAYMQKTGRDLVKGTLFFLRFRKPISHLFTPAEAEAARQWAYGLAKEISERLTVVQVFPDMKDSLFPDQPGSHCKHCPFATECYLKAPVNEKTSS